MKEIKFRAWCESWKQMIYSTDEWFFDKREFYPFCFVVDKREFYPSCFVVGFSGYPKKEEDYNLMQFTGLKDKNGKEIYEGDVLNWDNECTILIKWGEEIAGFYYEVLTQKNKNICSFDIRFYRSEESAKVIGNIYENKELLKVKMKVKFRRRK